MVILGQQIDAAEISFVSCICSCRQIESKKKILVIATK